MEKQYIWYVCYGSNLSRERFMKYINKCTDKMPPREDRPYILPNQLYFGGYSNGWGGPTAFVHTQHDEIKKTLGRAWMITAEQLEQVRAQETVYPYKYGNRLYLGTLEGLPVYTLTREPEFDLAEVGLPPQAYLDVIRQGLKETYPELDVDQYLNENLRYTSLNAHNHTTLE